MEKIEDVDVIIFSCATLTLICAVDMLSNEKAKKSRNQKTWVKDCLHERDAKVTFKWPRKFQEIFAYKYRHLSGSFNYISKLKAWTLNSKENEKRGSFGF